MRWCGIFTGNSAFRRRRPAATAGSSTWQHTDRGRPSSSAALYDVARRPRTICNQLQPSRTHIVTSNSLIVDRMTRIFREVFDDDTIEIRDDMTSKDIEQWDSLMHIDLIYGIEKEFKIVFSTGEAGSALKNVGELRTLVERKLAGRSG